MEGKINQLLEFKQRINEVHSSIKFDIKFSNKEINLLDNVVYKIPKGKLESKLYTKDTDRQDYLHRKSEHPESLKRNIPLAEALHLRRICTADKEYQLNCNELRKKLTERGYKGQEKNEITQRIQTFDRKVLLKEKEKKKTNGVLLIFTYNRTLPTVKKVVTNNWNLLQNYKDFKDIFQQIPISAFRRNKNLYDLLGCKSTVNSSITKNKYH